MKKKTLLLLAVIWVITVTISPYSTYAIRTGDDPPPEEEPAPTESPAEAPGPDLTVPAASVPDAPIENLETQVTLPEQELAPSASGSGEPAAAPAGLVGAEGPEAEGGGASGYDDIAVEDDLVAQPE